MAAVTLAVVSEQEYLGFDMVDAQIEEAQIGDVVSLTYDFGAGPRKIVGTYEGRETRDSGEEFIWVTESGAGRTRYAIPEGMVEALRVEAKAETMPTTVGTPAPRTRRARRRFDSLIHAGRSEFGRSCARLDYEGTVEV